MRTRLFASMLVLTLAFGSTASARNINNWKDISNYTAVGLVALSLAGPAVQKDWQGLRQAGYSVAVAEGIGFGMKSLIHEERPDNSGNDSFPSGHATAAFASATTIYKRYGWQVGVPAYGVATLTAVSRKLARKHHWHDVVAGAALGTVSGMVFTTKFNDKVAFVPWADTKGAGFSLAMAW